VKKRLWKVPTQPGMNSLKATEFWADSDDQVTPGGKLLVAVKSSGTKPGCGKGGKRRKEYSPP